MKTTIDPKYFAVVCGALVDSDAKSAVKYVDYKTVVRATWRCKPSNRNSREEMVVTFGKPNFVERKFLAMCKLAGELIPVKKVQYRAWPRRRA